MAKLAGSGTEKLDKLFAVNPFLVNAPDATN
jgi:hypothetical protein